MSKRILSIVMSLIVATSLIGCGSSKTNEEGGNKDAAQTENNGIKLVENDDLEGSWAKNYSLKQVQGFYKDYEAKVEKITKDLGLEYSKEENIKEENGQTMNENIIYFDNENPENNKMESMYFGLKTYGEDLSSGQIILKLSLKFDGEKAIQDNSFDLGKTTFAKYIAAITGQPDRNYSDLNNKILDGLKEGKAEVSVEDSIDGLNEEVIVSKDYVIYKLSTKKYDFSKADINVE